MHPVNIPVIVYIYPGFSLKLNYKLKNFDKTSDDIHRCVENTERILKNIPEEYQDIFRNKLKVLEVHKLLNKFTESQPWNAN